MNRKRNKNDNEYETKWEVFLRNYRTVPGFKALVKLSIYFIFILVFIAVASMNSNSKQTNSTPMESESETIKHTYKEILNEFMETNINITFTKEEDDNLTKITADNNDEIVSGILENDLGIKKFKIDKDQILEIKLNKELDGKELFNDIIIDFLIPKKLGALLNNHSAVKKVQDGKILYFYDLKYNDNIYKTTVTIENEKVNNVELTSNNTKYLVIYEY